MKCLLSFILETNFKKHRLEKSRVLKKYNLNTAYDLTAKKNNTAKQILLDVINMLKDLELHKPFRN